MKYLLLCTTLCSLNTLASENHIALSNDSAETIVVQYATANGTPKKIPVQGLGFERFDVKPFGQSEKEPVVLHWKGKNAEHSYSFVPQNFTEVVITQAIAIKINGRVSFLQDDAELFIQSGDFPIVKPFN